MNELTRGLGSNPYPYAEQDASCTREALWMKTSVRVTDLAIASDLSRMVVVGLDCIPSANAKPPPTTQDTAPNGQTTTPSSTENRLIIYDYASRNEEACVLHLPFALSATHLHDQFHSLGWRTHERENLSGFALRPCKPRPRREKQISRRSFPLIKADHNHPFSFACIIGGTTVGSRNRPNGT